MKRVLATILMLVCAPAVAQDRQLDVAAPPALEQSGLLQHILPRFGLKFGIRTAVADGATEAVFGDAGVPVFVGLGRTWHLQGDTGEEAAKFADWLQSEIGRRTVASFAPDGTAPFSPEIRARTEPKARVFDGDPVEGRRLSFAHCGRCHVIDETNRMKGIGATPSFGVLRTLAEWEHRFATFYVLKPHPSFTQIEGLTPPFDPARPSPIFPLTLRPGEIDAILAFVAGIAPADLGAPVQAR